MSDSIKERVGTDNGIQVMHLRPLPGWRQKYYCSVVIKVATRDEQIKILARATEGLEMTLHGCSLKITPFVDDRRPLAC